MLKLKQKFCNKIKDVKLKKNILFFLANFFSLYKNKQGNLEKILILIKN